RSNGDFQSSHIAGQHARFAVRRANGSRLAFSLIELLVTIAIIAILLGLIIPALHQAKAKTRSIICLNNLRQWGQAMTMYATDNDDFLPPEGTGSSINSQTAWYVALPKQIGMRSYYDNPWYTNAKAPLGVSI